jgi:hypothetical protein
MSQGQATLARSGPSGSTRPAAPPVAVSSLAVWGVLFLRPALALVAQALVAGAFVLAGTEDPWRLAADWWLAWFGAVSVVNLAVLRLLMHREGRRLRDLYRFEREGRRTDLAWAAAAFVVSGPIALLPNVLVGQALWGTSQTAADLSFRPLPVVAAAILVLTFPVIHAMAELPTYFGYVMPRMAARTGWQWRAMLVPAIVLSTQHILLPLLIDWRFVVWRALMFLPFAVWIGFVVMRRPSTLPYLVVGHALLDLSLPILVLLAST